jgi:23S rRNA pseudouridine2605 synthase
MENEKKNEEMSVDQQTSTPQEGGYQGYKPGRSPRPRIHQPRPYTSQAGYSRSNSQEDGGFRPEGFGAGLQGGAPQRGSYRPRNNYNNDGGYQPRPRQQYGQQNEYGSQPRSGYQPRPRQQYGETQGEYGQQRSSYQPRPRQQYGETQGEYGQPRSGYQPRQAGYQPRQGGYGQQGGYQQRQGGYGQQGGYQQRQGGYQQGGYRQGGYQQGGYGQRQGGYGQQRNNAKKQRGGYDPNAKYSQKKRIEYKEENYDPNEPIRLNKFLANAGVCSRREADEFIQAGVVTVNGQVITELGSKVLRTDEVRFHDTPVTPEKKVYVLLNKPKDYVTTSDDPQQRKTVMDLVKNACQERIYPVGRLDRNTTGVLLLTNDGDLASKLTHPKFLKKKIYHVHLDKNVTAHDMQQIAEGINLEDGEIKADAIEYASETDKKQVGIEIHSGKNRIVRRIFESLGYKVTKLDRVQFAGLTKKNVKRGDWRYLTEEEVDRLRMGAYE